MKDDMSDRNDRIREIAYFLWMDEGRPEGQADRHWQYAEVIVDSEPLERKRTEGEPPGEPATGVASVAGSSSLGTDTVGASAAPGGGPRRAQK